MEHDVQSIISGIGIIPVISIEDEEKAVPLAHALSDGGIPAAEITFRTAVAEGAIKKISQNCPDIFLGAGTVLNIEQCDRALSAGAKFIVSPGYNSDLVHYCLSKNVPVFPGCVNASDLTRAVNDGLTIVKYFPAEQSGGLAGLKALAPVFPSLRFMPTGGINANNLLNYLSYDRIIACGGSWMVKKELIEAENWSEITQLCKNAVQTMLGFEVYHVGINCANPEQSQQDSQSFSSIFQFALRSGNSSNFASERLEFTKHPYLGTHGHIAIGTWSMDRALYHLAAQGIEFREDTRKRDKSGKTTSIYLKQEIAGFAVHLLQKGMGEKKHG